MRGSEPPPLFAPVQRHVAFHEGCEIDSRRLIAFEDGALQIGRQERKPDQPAPPGLIGCRRQDRRAWSILPEHRVRVAQRAHQRRIGTSRDPGAGLYLAAAGADLHTKRQGEAHHGLVRRIGDGRLTRSEPGTKAQQTVDRQQHVEAGFMNLDPPDQCDRIVRGPVQEPDEGPGKGGLDGRRRDAARRIVLRSAAVALLQRRRDIVAVEFAGLAAKVGDIGCPSVSKMRPASGERATSLRVAPRRRAFSSSLVCITSNSPVAMIGLWRPG